VQDAKGIKPFYNPHFFWQPCHRDGRTTFAFDLRIDERTNFSHEWREEEKASRTSDLCFHVQLATVLPWEVFVLVRTTMKSPLVNGGPLSARIAGSYTFVEGGRFELPLRGGSTMSRKMVCAVVCGVLCCVVLSARAGDWPVYHGPKYDLTSTETGWTTDWPADGPKELWRVDVGIGFSAASVANGKVYTMGNKKLQGKETDIVWCLDAETGKTLWEHSYPCRLGKFPGPRITPTVDGDRVYTLSREGLLLCLDANTGKVKWSKNTRKEYGAKQTRFNWGFASSPRLFGEKLILDIGPTVALNKVTGDKIWVAGNDESGFSSVTTSEIDGKTYVNAFNAAGLVLLDIETGKEQARFPWGSKKSYFINTASPIFKDGKIFISAGYGIGCALVKADKSGLKAIYKNTDMGNHCATCVLHEGHLYGLHGQNGRKGSLVCMEFDTGKVVWEQKGMTPGSLMMADGKLLVQLDHGELLVAEATPAGYKELARTKVLSKRCWNYAVLSNGRIYCRGNDTGELVCLDVRK